MQSHPVPRPKHGKCISLPKASNQAIQMHIQPNPKKQSVLNKTAIANPVGQNSC